MSHEEIFKYEQQHLTDIYQDILMQEIQANEALGNMKTKQKEVFAEDDSYLSSSPEAMASTQQQKSVFEDIYRKVESLEKKQAQLAQLHQQAYFGRIDLVEKDFPEDLEEIYIGNHSFITDDHDIKIYDWRAPICSVFYQSNVGEGHYQSPQGQIDIHLRLKRTFMIAEDVLNQVFDVEDENELLTNVLSQKNESYMKPIVATIQAKQNEIIRDLQHKNILVQGCAGSGKTAILLQRISYLLYPQEKQLNAQQILLFSPNPYFSAYISQVLPDLGEKYLNQITLPQFLDELSPLEIITADENPKIANLKNQPEILEKLQDYLQHLTIPQLKIKDIKIQSNIIVKAKEFAKLFDRMDKNLPILNQITLVKEALITLVQKRLEKLQTSDKLEQEIHNLSNTQYNMLLNNKVFQNYDDELKYIAGRLKKRTVQYFLKNTDYAQFIDFPAQYLDFLAQLGSTKQLTEQKITKADWQSMLENLEQQFTEETVNETDALLILYLKASLFEQDLPGFKHIFIDEVQNFSTNLLLLLRKIYPKTNFTLVGDENQTADHIYHNIYQAAPAVQSLFGINHLYTLNVSYRATKQITEFSKQILADEPAIEAFDRDGLLPQIYLTKSTKDSFVKAIELIKSDDSSNIAIITKTQKEAELFARYCTDQQLTAIQLIQPNQKSQPARVMILAAESAKGVEYDKVILLNVTAENYQTSRDRLLLYTLCTRAKHELYLFAEKQLPIFLEKIDKKAYEKYAI